MILSYKGLSKKKKAVFLDSPSARPSRHFDERSEEKSWMAKIKISHRLTAVRAGREGLSKKKGGPFAI